LSDDRETSVSVLESGENADRVWRGEEESRDDVRERRAKGDGGDK